LFLEGLVKKKRERNIYRVPGNEEKIELGTFYKPPRMCRDRLLKCGYFP
jgi:hypothetical protein